VLIDLARQDHHDLLTVPDDTLQPMSIEDRVVGSVLGLALGDALGAPFEFRRARDIPDPIPALELPWRGGPAGSTTDDTAMARNLIGSLVDRRGFDPDDLVDRHLRWLDSGPSDVGSFTARVLRRLGGQASPARPEHAGLGSLAADAARAIWEERGPEVSAGNGSIMYCPPLGAAYAGRPDLLGDLAPRLSALTHFDARCRTGVLVVTIAVGALVRGERRDEAVNAALGAAVDREGGEELEFLVESAGGARPIDGPDQGFCLFAAAAGLQALARGGTFDRELRRVVGLGGDTDTNAAVAGALVGAAVGRTGLPDPWLERLIDRVAIEEEGESLARMRPEI
jgi:ADP-ribosylglycohydrolase